MSPNDQSANGVWHLLEQLYLDSASGQESDAYAGLSGDEKRVTLLAFANAQAATSKRRAAIVGNLRFVGLTV
jgi:hypothetical protein